MDMVEKVARALYAIRMESAKSAGLHDPYVWETDNNAYREHCLREARAAIDAMREPPEALRKFNTADGNLIDWSAPCSYCGGHKFAWQAMIDAALTPPPSGEL